MTGRPRKSVPDVTCRPKFKGGPLTFYWRDSITHKVKSQRVEGKTPAAIKIELAELQHKLRLKCGKARAKWMDFIAAARAEYIPEQADDTKTIINRVIRMWEAANGLMNDVSSIGAVEISNFRAEIKKVNDKRRPQSLDGKTKSRATHGKDLRHLKALLNWGKNHGFIQEIVKIEMPKRKRGFLGKGRPISDHVFEGFCKAIAKDVGEENADSWVAALQGMWHSAFRLGEVLAFTFDRVKICKSGAVIIEWDHEDQKSGRAETTPTTPEFGELIKSMPHREGLVFRPTLSKGIIHPNTFSHRVDEVCAIYGHKFTSHDLRRSFADRWARKVTPLVLSRLMRCSVEVIREYYAELESESLSLELIREYQAAKSKPKRLKTVG